MNHSLSNGGQKKALYKDVEFGKKKRSGGYGSIKFGIFYITLLSLITWFIAYILFKKGYKIKS